MDALALTTGTKYFDEGSTIVKEGDKGDMFYMIEEGTVAVTKENLGSGPICILKKGDFFGEKALLSDETRMATYRATSNVTCLVLVRKDFVRIAGNLKEILDEPKDRRRAFHRQVTTIKTNANVIKRRNKYK